MAIPTTATNKKTSDGSSDESSVTQTPLPWPPNMSDTENEWSVSTGDGGLFDAYGLLLMCQDMVYWNR